MNANARLLDLHFARTAYMTPEIKIQLVAAVKAGIVELNADGTIVRRADRRSTARTTPDRRTAGVALVGHRLGGASPWKLRRRREQDMQYRLDIVDPAFEATQITADFTDDSAAIEFARGFVDAVVVWRVSPEAPNPVYMQKGR